MVGSRRDSLHSSRSGANSSCTSPHRSTLFIRRGQEPFCGGFGEALLVVGNAGQGSPVYIPGSLSPQRGQLGWVDAQADRILSLGTRGAAELSGRSAAQAHRENYAASAENSECPG